MAALSLSPDQTGFNAGEPVQINVTVTNQGAARAEAFWVDFYINPVTPPTQAGTFWYDTCGLEPCYGLTWEAYDGLDPGESITFTSTPGSYHDRSTVWPGYFAAGTSDLYVYVDSYGSLGGNGATRESNESNNRTELHGLTVAGITPAGGGLIETQLPVGLRSTGAVQASQGAIRRGVNGLGLEIGEIEPGATVTMEARLAEQPGVSASSPEQAPIRVVFTYDQQLMPQLVSLAAAQFEPVKSSAAVDAGQSDSILPTTGHKAGAVKTCPGSCRP